MTETHEFLGRGAPNILRPVEVMKAFFAAYVLGDDDGLLELTHPDALLLFPGSPKRIPWAGAWRGSNLERMLDIVKDSLHFLEYRPVEFIEAGDDRVAVRCWERVRARSTGKEHDNRHMGVATIRDGLLLEWQEYGDTAAQESVFVEDSALTRA